MKDGKEGARSQPQRRRRLTPRQRKLLRAIIEKPDATLEEIGRQAGYAGRQHVARALKSPNVQAAFRDLMDTCPQLERKALAQKLAEGLDATMTKFFAHEGKVRDKRVCVDFLTRHKYLELALRLNGDLKLDIVSNGKTLKDLVID